MSSKTPKEGTPLSGEVIERGDAPLRNVAQTGAGKTIQKLLSFVSRFPFRNRQHLRTVQTATEVVRAQTELKEAYIKHQQTKGRLEDIEVIVGKDRLERAAEYVEASNRLNAARLEQETWEQKKQRAVDEMELRDKYELAIQKLEFQEKEQRLKKQIAELSKPLPESPKHKKTARGRSEKQKAIDRAYRQYHKELERIDKMQASPAHKETLKKAARGEYEETVEKIQDTPRS